MKYWKNTVGVLAILMATATSAIAQDAVNAKTVVATVNGTDITLGHLILAYETLPDQYKSLPVDQLYSGLLDQIVQQTVLAQSATKPDATAILLSLENEKRLLQAGQAVDELTTTAVTDEALQKAYDEKYTAAGVDLGVEFNASHILVETEDKAKEIEQKLADGADFEELAKTMSTGPSAPNGGQLGWFSKGMMVGEFEDAVAKLEKGQVSAPVQTQFGWHVIKLNDTRPVAAPEFDAVKGELAGELQRKAVEDRIKELQDSATITRTDPATIDATLLQNLSLLEQ